MRRSIELNDRTPHTVVAILRVMKQVPLKRAVRIMQSVRDRGREVPFRDAPAAAVVLEGLSKPEPNALASGSVAKQPGIHSTRG